MKQNGADEKKVGVFFEFFLECFYFKHVQFKFQEHDNNNSHQFKELLHKNPKVPQKQKSVLRFVIYRRGLYPHHFRSLEHRNHLSHQQNDQTLPPHQPARAKGSCRLKHQNDYGKNNEEQ